MKIWTPFILIVMILSSVVTAHPVIAEEFSCDYVTEIPLVECEALVALYESTFGDSWDYNTNWLLTYKPSDWYGITVVDGNVHEISLPMNSLAGTIPSEIENFNYLRTLNFAGNRITSPIPGGIGYLLNLRYLYLNYNQFSGTIPPQLGNLLNLQDFSLRGNLLSGAIPPELGNLTKLVSFSLGENQLSGSIPETLGNLINLEILGLGYNQLTGTIPSSLGNLSNLQQLGLQDNQLTGSIPASLGNLGNLITLSLYNNQLSGAIPPELGNLSKLVAFELFNNQLSGNIPSTLGNLSSVEDIFLWNNQLSGNIPAQLGSLPTLYQLALNDNYLSGSIPAELGNIIRLQYLDLSNNYLSGYIPSGLANAVNLRFLHLDNNQLSGPIPLSFTNYYRLEEFYFFNTYICEPTDPEFLVWKATVDDWQGTGLICEVAPQIELTAIEVTQVIQNLHNDVFLIKNKPTFVRAYVRGLVQDVENVSARLKGYRPDGTLLCSLRPSNPGGSITVYKKTLRDQLNDSFNFILPAACLSGEVVFKVTGIDQDFVCNDTDNDCKTQVAFEETPNIDLRFIRIFWRDSSSTLHYPDYEDLKLLTQRIEAMFPTSRIIPDGIGQMDLGTETWLIPAANFMKINLNLITKRTLDGCGLGCNQIYLGVLVDPPYENGVMGYANIIQPTVASGFHDEIVYYESIPHELGHVFGEVDEDKVKTNISEILQGDGAYWGFDYFKSRIFSPQTVSLMSYDWNSHWQSYLAYDRIHTRILDLYGTTKTSAFINETSYLLITGQIDIELNVGSIEEVLQNTSSAVFPSYEQGEYEIQLKDAESDVIASYFFDPDTFSECPTCEDDDPIGIFSLQIPYHPDATQILLLHNELMLDSVAQTPNQPSIEITYPNGGEVISGDLLNITWDASDLDEDGLTYVVQYSVDSGLTWQTIDTNIKVKNYPLYLSHIGGSDTALIRVWASDGFHTTMDVSDAIFQIEKHAPHTLITGPENSEFFVEDQTVIFTGYAIDNEDGDLNDANLNWSSNLDGLLGTGSSLDINAMDLTEGTHTITLTGQDSDGQTGSAAIEITIYRERPVLPVQLSTAPDWLSFTTSINSGITEPQIISIRNDGDGDLTWTASSDQPWVILNQSAGIAPSEILVSVDPFGLPPGEYEATVTVSAPSANDSPQIVSVFLTVLDRSTIFIPIIFR